MPGPEDMTREQLIAKIQDLQKRVGEIEYSKSECMLAKAVVQENEEQFRSIIDQAKSIIIYLTADYDILEFNHEAELLYGVKRENALGKNYIETFLPEEARETVIADIEKVLKGGESKDFESPVKAADGSLRITSWNVGRVVGPDGKPLGVVAVGRDMTERKKQGEALERSEERFRQIAKNAQEWIWEIDPDGIFTYASPVVEKVLGFKPEEIVGKKHFYDLFHPDVREELERKALGMFPGREPVKEFISQNIHKDGRIAWISTSGVPIFDEKGEFAGYRGANVDITERKKAEDEIKSTNERLKYLLRSAATAIYTSKISGDYGATSITENVKEITGYEAKEFIENSSFWVDHIHPDDRERVLSEMSKTFDTGENVYEYRFQNKDGLYIWVRDDMRLMEDGSGNPAEIVGNWIDITERKKIEESLKDSEKKSRTWLEHSPVCTKIVDLDLNLQYMSRAGIEGLCVDDVTKYYGKPFPFDFYSKPVRKSMTENLKKVMETGEIITQDTPAINAKGKELWFHSTFVPVKDDEGRIEYIIIVSVDITELEEYRTHLEDLIKERTEELESFSYSVSHDLRAPLRAIDGFSQILLEDHSKELNSEGKRLLGVVRNNAGKMGELIDDLLDFSRAGRKEIMLEETDMGSVADEVRENLKPSIGEKKVKLDIKKLPVAKCDRAMMVRVFENLLSNSIKFTGPVKKPVIEVGSEEKSDENIYFVKDNGVGFNPKYKDKLFNVFQRLHRTEDFSGTGVGLAIVNRIVKRHGGRVWAEGAEGKGATFYFALPKNKAK
ncbi:PAS domain S-box protein [Candidatus Omnitrophota bacterium]